MSFISDLVEKFTGLDLDGSSERTVKHPCSNCPSNCAIAGEACTLCEPYKKKLIDAVYNADHIEEFRSRYEVVSNAAQVPFSGGTVTCPRCGAPSNNHYICDYCGVKLSDEPVPSGKIRVSAASEIPNPIMEAQDIIYDRYNAIVKKYTSRQSSPGGFLSNFLSEIIGTDPDDDSAEALGGKMSEAEIKEAAGLYGVSVGDYLTGLDNGRYLNLSAKKQADAQGHSSWSPASDGMSGLAGIGMIASILMNGSSGKRPPSFPSKEYDFQMPQSRPRPGQHPGGHPVRPTESRPSAPERERPAGVPDRRPSEPSRPRPAQQNDPRPSQHSRPSQSDHWKERDPGRRRG